MPDWCSWSDERGSRAVAVVLLLLPLHAVLRYLLLLCVLCVLVDDILHRHLSVPQHPQLSQFALQQFHVDLQCESVMCEGCEVGRVEWCWSGGLPLLLGEGEVGRHCGVGWMQQHSGGSVRGQARSLTGCCGRNERRVVRSMVRGEACTKHR